MVALVEAWDETRPNVDLFYCFRGQSEAPHLDELKAMTAELANITLHTIDSSQGQRLSGQTIANVCGEGLKKHSVLFCGPSSMRDMLKNELKEYGVSQRHFHFEEFEIRTDFWPISLLNTKVRSWLNKFW